MPTPKVIFVEYPQNREADWIYGFLFYDEWGWGKQILRTHPQLKKILSFNKKRDRMEFLNSYISKHKESNAQRINDKMNSFSRKWSKIEKEYFELLTYVMRTEWPAKRKVIKSYISINPICPRFLKEWAFAIFYNYKKRSHAIETIMHETCHFIYFKKWLEVFPNANPKTFESPHIEWHLSEIMAPIILNDPRVQKLLQQKAYFYEEHKQIKIGNISAVKYFTNLYNKTQKEGLDFSEFLKRAYVEIKRYEKSFIS